MSISPKYTTDIEAIVNRSFLSPDPPSNPLAIVLSVNSATSREGFDQESACAKCYRWDNTAQEKFSTRPTGTWDRDFCNGCAFSFLDPVHVDQDALRDRLYQEWSAAKARMEDVKAAKRHALSLEARHDWRAENHLATRQLSEATRACFLAGFNPLKKSRREGEMKPHDGK